MAVTFTELAANIRTATRASAGQFSIEDVKACINMAIDAAISDGLYVPVEDETLVHIAETYEYGLTGSADLLALVAISEIWNESETDGVYLERVDPRYWSVELDSTPYIKFWDLAWGPTSDRQFRIKGFKIQPRITDPDDTIYLPTHWVTWKSIEFAHGILSGAVNAAQSSWHERRVAACKIEVEAARLGAKRWWVPNGSKWIPNRM